MKQLFLILIVLLISNLTFGQVVNFQAGTSISKIKWASYFPNLYGETLLGYSTFLGIDYMDRTYYNWSSNIGFLRKGGKSDFPTVNEDGTSVGTQTFKAKLNYFTVNTAINFKYPIKEKIVPFVSLGLRVDYLTSYSSTIFTELDNIDAIQKMNAGAILGAGVKYDLSKIQVGLRGDYYLNFFNVAKWQGYQVKDNTFTVNLTIGYKLH